MNIPEKKTALIVDDDEMLRETIVFDFKRRGFEVFSASDGLEAFSIIQKEQIDVVITDVRMPNCSGIELLDKIKSYNVNIPVVIFVTGFTDLSTEDAYDRGANVVMSKPFDRKVLMENVNRQLLSSGEKFATEEEESTSFPKLEFVSTSGEEFCLGHGLSIGRGGMCVLANTAQEQVLGKRVSFEIQHVSNELPNLSGNGVVRWIKGEGKNRLFGVEFLFLKESCRAAVVNFISKLSIKAYIPKP